MNFEAELKGVKYKVEVLEFPKSLKVSLQAEGGEKKLIHLSKSEYQHIDNAVSLILNRQSFMVDVLNDGIESLVFTRGSYRVIPLYNDETLLHESLKSGGSVGGSNQMMSGMPGKIVKVLVEKGQEVKANEPILVMEAMKMENEMRTTHTATVVDVKVKPGESVEAGAVLVVFDK